MELRPLLIAVSVILAMSGVSSADAAHAVWSGLVIAENVPQPAAIPPELTKFEQTLKDLFGYNQFELIGQSSKTLRTGEEDWLAASKYFALHVDARGSVARSSPLVIKGPQVGSGQLLLVLVVKDDQQTHQHRRAEPTNPITAGWHRLRRAIHNILP